MKRRPPCLCLRLVLTIFLLQWDRASSRRSSIGESFRVRRRGLSISFELHRRLRQWAAVCLYAHGDDPLPPVPRAPGRRDERTAYTARPTGLPLLFICFMPRVVKLSRLRHTFLSSMVAVASLFLFPFRIVNFIQCVGNLVQKHQVRSTHAAETFD